jgi:hypothetical protein
MLPRDLSENDKRGFAAAQRSIDGQDVYPSSVHTNAVQGLKVKGFLFIRGEGIQFNLVPAMNVTSLFDERIQYLIYMSLLV